MKTTKFQVCYKSKEGFEMYLQDSFSLLFAHHSSNGLEFDSEKSAQEQIESFHGRCRADDIAKLYVKMEGAK